MGIVSTIPEKCRRCYTCVRQCPAKAIKVERGQAMVIDERCIACGNCVKVCAQKAKRIEDGTESVNVMLAGEAPVFACLAPSFPAAFAPVRPESVISAVRALGFEQVWETAFGAELISREYVRLVEEAGAQNKRVITSPCPAIIEYTQRFLPELKDSLAPVVSPMIAAARAIRSRHGRNVKIVFIGPCIAKKREIENPSVRNDVDEVLTFLELARMLERAGIDAASMPESEFDGPHAAIGRSFPISGGLLRTAGLSADILDNDVVVTEGKDRALDALWAMARGESRTKFLDVLFCEGCIDGPKMPGDSGIFARKEIIAEFVNRRGRAAGPGNEDIFAEFSGIDLSRSFEFCPVFQPPVTEEAVQAVLADMRKSDPKDQLNCGACGYSTCREKAVAVCQGLAEREMCLPYMIEELEETCANLEKSHNDLADAHQRLVQSERLASMGQLSAGVAHELNNPLGTVLVYSHMLLRQLKSESELRPDLEMIVREATRCKIIVRGLLDFARQSHAAKTPTNVPRLLEEVAALMSNKAGKAGARINVKTDGALAEFMLDGNQIKQMLINIADNAIDASAAGGTVEITAGLRSADGKLELKVRDSGCGIPAEHLPKLFDPFFTTKEMGKGTGLGLAIAYGIVKMHGGEITVNSKVGEGSLFAVSLPAEEKKT